MCFSRIGLNEDFSDQGYQSFSKNDTLKKCDFRDIDIKTAFPNGSFKEKMHMKKLEGYGKRRIKVNVKDKKGYTRIEQCMQA